MHILWSKGQWLVFPHWVLLHNHRNLQHRKLSSSRLAVQFVGGQRFTKLGSLPVTSLIVQHYVSDNSSGHIRKLVYIHVWTQLLMLAQLLTLPNVIRLYVYQQVSFRLVLNYKVCGSRPNRPLLPTPLSFLSTLSLACPLRRSLTYCTCMRDQQALMCMLMPKFNGIYRHTFYPLCTVGVRLQEQFVHDC